MISMLKGEHLIWKYSESIHRNTRKYHRFVASKKMPALIIAVIIISMLSSQYFHPAFAIHKSESVKWQLVFLSSYKACSNYQYQTTNKYDTITEKYFAMYQFENSRYKPLCMPDTKYSNYKVPDDLDLLILVYDKNLGRKELHTYDVGGLYNHVGTDRTKDHTIVFCDCPNFKYSDPVWILTHELSHFILYYLGFDKSIAEVKIHTLDAKYDHCIEVHYDETCSSVKTKIRVDFYAYSWTAMTPYAPAIGKSFIQPTNVTSLSPYAVYMQKEITKWWLAGKINDTDYTKSLTYLLDSQKVNPIEASVYSSQDTSNIIFTDGPNDKEINETWYDVKTEWNKDKVSSVLGRIPFKADSETDSILYEGNQIHLPQWFKSRAHWWADSKLWTDDEFLSSVGYLFSKGIIKKEN